MQRERAFAGSWLAGVPLLALVAVGGAGAASSHASNGATGEHSGLRIAGMRPNIVVIMADDMRADDLQWMPETRRLIADAGVSFVNSFASLPLCSPSRASFLTGRYAHNHGVFGDHRLWGFHAFDDSSTIATDLQSLGYRTGLVGKYLNGYGKQPPPGRPAGVGSRHYVPPGWTAWRGAPTVTTGPLRGSVYNYRNTTMSRDGRLVSLRGQYNTRALGAIAAQTIRQWAVSRRPFFLYESYLAPHFGGPHEADDPPMWQSRVPRIAIRTPAVTSAVRDRFDSTITGLRGHGEADVADKAAWLRELPTLSHHAVRAMIESARQRAEALVELDRQVLRTISTLRSTGALRRTVVIFTSDNGWFEGEHRIEADKTIPYEPAFRVPLLMRGPTIPHGVVRTGPAINIDLAPTIDAIAGAASTRAMDGRSLLRVARSGGSGWDRPILSETGPRTALDIWARDAIELSGTHFPRGARAVVGVRTHNFTYLKWATGEVELYDTGTDPEQLDSLAGKPRYERTQARLDALATHLRDCLGAACRRP